MDNPAMGLSFTIPIDQEKVYKTKDDFENMPDGSYVVLNSIIRKWFDVKDGIVFHKNKPLMNRADFFNRYIECHKKSPVLQKQF